MCTPSMKNRVAEFERRTMEIKAALVPSPEPSKLRFHSAFSQVYARRMAQLEETLETPATRTEVMDVTHGTIYRIVLTSFEGDLRAELFGDIAVIVAACDATQGK